MEKRNCFNCGKEVYRHNAEIKKVKNIFCSHSCAARINNKVAKKRKLKKTCKVCGKFIRSCSIHCRGCANSPLANKTLAEAIQHAGSNRYSSIRGRARTIFAASDRNKCCVLCGYDKHIEVCHIRDISDFPLDTLISTINDISNLIGLCPNCHWEFDHDLITLPTSVVGTI